MLSSLIQNGLLWNRPENGRIVSARFQTMTQPAIITQVHTPTAEAEEDASNSVYIDLQNRVSINSVYTNLQNRVIREHKNDMLIVMQECGPEKEWTITGSWEHMDSEDKGTIEGNVSLASAMQMIYTDPTQNSSRPKHQDADV